METLRALFKKYFDRLDALSLRERAIVFVAVMAVLYTVSANFLFPPLTTEQNRLKKQLTEKRAQIQLFDAQVQAALAKSAQDPDAPNRARLAALETQLKGLDETLARVTTRLVPPKEMPQLVEQIISRNPRLHLMKIESLGAEPLQTGTAMAGKKQGAKPSVMVYRHGTRIELKGGYLDLLEYLNELENLPWKFFWGQATLQVERYPVSRLVLHIYTLSTQEGWIAI